MKNLFFGLLVLGLLFTSCSDDESSDSNANTSVLTLNLTGLEDLGDDFVYEGWVLVDGVPQTTGLFTVDGDENLSQTTFNVDTEMLEAATKFILTVEPVVDLDPAPSDQKYIAGDFDGNAAQVSTSTAPAIGDFSSSTGTFFLRTPTDEEVGSDNNGNDQYGVWFGLPGMPPSANLVLPELPVGWIYEGWVIGEAGPISTGTFLDFGDFDSSNILSGTLNNQGPPVPGEDFFNNASAGETFPLDIRGRTVVISVEPVPDNSPAPFALKPLAGVSGNETAPSSHPFGLNVEQTFPTGTATR